MMQMSRVQSNTAFGWICCEHGQQVYFVLYVGIMRLTRISRCAVCTCPSIQLNVCWLCSQNDMGLYLFDIFSSEAQSALVFSNYIEVFRHEHTL